MKKIIPLLLGASLFIFASCGKEPVKNPEPPIDNSDKVAPVLNGTLRTTVTFNSASLIWDAATDNVGISGYKVYRNGTQITTTNSLNYTDIGLAPLTGYEYKVIAQDAAGNVSTEIKTNVTTSSAPALPTVGNTTINVGSITNNSMTVSTIITGNNISMIRVIKEWNEPITGQIKRDSVDKGNSTDLVSHTWTNNIPGMKYRVWFSAINTTGYTAGGKDSASQTGYHVGQVVLSGMAKVWKTTPDANHYWFGVINRPIMMWDPTVPAPTFVGATSTTDGRSNTLAIVNALPNVNTIAKYCYGLTLGGQVPIGTCWQGSVDEYIEISNSQVFPEISDEGFPAWNKGAVHTSTETAAPSNKIVGWYNQGTTTSGTLEKSNNFVAFAIGYK